MKKTMYATIAVIAAESCFATVWPTVNTVAEFTNAVAKAVNGDRIVLAAGKTFDFSTLSAYNDGTSWGTMSAPSGDSSGKSCVWFSKRLEILGEDTSRYDEKTVEQETIVKGGNDGRIFYGYAGNGRQSSFAHLTFLGGTAESGKNGGAVYFLLKTDAGKATNCVFRGCSANTGGATYCVSAYGCLFADNTSDDRGGAALGDGNEFVGCVFRGNTACGIGGGALRENHLAKDIVGCVFSNNVATAGHSGALYINEMASGSSAKIVGCRFENNSANTQGGAMSGLGDIENCVFIGNTAGANGGAVAFSSGYSLTGSCFVGNTASEAGGAVYAPRIAAVSNCAFTNNYAIGACGGVFLASVTGIFTDCFFHSNTGVVTTAGGQLCKAMEVVGCRFSGNGDVYARNFERCEFDGCEYTYFNQGHTLEGIVSYDTTIGNGHLRNCLFHGCNAARLIVSGGVRVDVENCTFADNVSTYNAFTAFRGGSPVVGSVNVFVNCIFYNTELDWNDVAGGGNDFYATAYQADGQNILSNCLFHADGGVAIKTSGGFQSQNMVNANVRFAGTSAEFAGKVPYYTPCSAATRDTGLDIAWMLTGIDLVGNARVNGDHVDIGCYESYLPKPGCTVIVY